MTEQRARQLLASYLQKSATPAEQQELFDWINHSPNDALLNRMLQEAWQKFQPGVAIENDRAEQMLEQILSSDQATAALPKRAPVFMLPIYKWAAAAVLLISAGLLAYRSFHAGKPVITKTIAAVSPVINRPEILPGTTAARLTLGDGSSIVLDSVSGSAIAAQGSTRIVRRNGTIIYEKGTSQPVDMLYNTLSTDRGHQYPLTLSDGTKVFLNAASSIHFPVTFSGTQRLVEITGEAYFEVAKNGKPFIVRTSTANIEVLGTHFDVNGYTDEASLTTTLLEGAVKVTRGKVEQLLVPGQQARVQQDGSIALNTHADTEAAISWTHGYFHFNDASLETVLRQLSRWYDVDILYEKHYPEESFGGDIQKSLTLTQVLKILEKSQVRFRVDGKRLIVI